MLNKIVDGATPNVTISARESSSFPIGELTFNNRADIPSKKSNTAPMIIHVNDISILPLKAYAMAIQPDIRLQQVIVLGMCFLIAIFKVYLLIS